MVASVDVVEEAARGIDHRVAPAHVVVVLGRERDAGVLDATVTRDERAASTR